MIDLNSSAEHARLDRFFSYTRMGWWEADFTTQCYSCPNILAHILGLPDSVMTFEQFHSFIAETHRAEVVEEIASHAFENGCERNFLFVFPGKEAAWVCLKLDRADADGKGSGYLRLLDRVECELLERNQAKRLSGIQDESLLRHLFESMPVGLELYNREGVFVDVNRKGIEILARDKETMLGITLFDQLNISLEMCEQLQRGQDVYFHFGNDSDELKGHDKDVLVRVTTLRAEDGEITHYLVIAIDCAESGVMKAKMKDFENVFQLIGDFAKIGYGKLNPMTSEGYAIGQWFLNFGESEVSDFRDSAGKYTQLYSEDQEKIKKFNREAIEGNAKTFKDEVRVIFPDGKTKWISVNMMVSHYEPERRLVEIVGVNYDVTHLKEMEEQMTLAKEKAEQMDKLKSVFLANMSHEIRTPLNAIVGFSKLLGEDVDMEDKALYVNIIEENNDLLLQLISDILDLSKIEAGTFEFVDSEVDVRHLCQDVCQAMRLRMPEGVELVFDDQIPDWRVYCDKNRLHQVISNFINNAIKFTFTGKIEVSVCLRNKELKICVKDTGIGIAKDKLASVFDRFVKLNGTVKGTGLGLAICKSIVKQFGGQIGAESEEGVGSCFWLTLPSGRLLTGEESDQEECVEQSVGLEMVDCEGKRPIILIAEDTESNYLFFRMLLKNRYDLYWVKNGVEAVTMCRSLKPDLILMDVRMPEMDGLAATRCIREFNASIPILIVTAFAFEEDRRKAMEAGCDDFLTKPVSPDELRIAMQKWLMNSK